MSQEHFKVRLTGKLSGQVSNTCTRVVSRYEATNKPASITWAVQILAQHCACLTVAEEKEMRSPKN